MGIILVVISLIIDISVGPATIPIKDVLKSLLKLPVAKLNTNIIVWNVRLPAALMAVAVGAALGVSGACMQTILNNPLASPYTLGISAGAGFGASLAIVLGFGQGTLMGSIGVSLSAFIFSLLASAIIYFIGKSRNMKSEIMILSGIGILFLFQALQSFMQYIASPEVLQSIVFWLFGSFSKANLANVGIIYLALLIFIPLIIKDSWKLTAMRLGDERAENLGVNTKNLRIKVFIIISILTSVAVSIVGTIGFIGLVSPHIARLLVGEDQRFFLSLSTISGMLILSIASIISKVIIPGIIFPIGIITAMIGVPFFFSLIFSKRRVG
ncbi:FecCD family ABC transporter permease [Haloimpatiens massiliensis]|uniref:FecCD family ABC transporter permease n=1 Tax=Haloimpatiens massiliensis TaxID=1658110 RepID=UPI001FA8AD27|nr:iron ABC transporter permease [Haloimpatiens massiliensis]